MAAQQPCERKRGEFIMQGNQLSAITAENRTMVGKEELGTFIVQKCTSNTDGYTNYISSMNLI